MGCGCSEDAVAALAVPLTAMAAAGDAAEPVLARRSRGAKVRVPWWCRPFGWFCRFYIALLKRPKRGDPCVYFPERVINRPDPAIYSQFLLMELEQPVTWDNPDVALFLNGVEQYTYDLIVNTDYELVVTVHNSSRSKPAPGTRVDVRWIEFGAGAQIRHPIATLTANVPVFPGTAAVQTAWRTPATPGHYCIEVELEHPEDGNPANNRGWNNTQVKAAASEVRTDVRVFNRYPDGCPPVRTGGYDLRRSQILGWTAIFGLFGLAMGVLQGERGVAGALAGLAAGAAFGALVGYARELWRRWSYERRSTRRHGDDVRDPQRGEVPCGLVEIVVDGYTFTDGKGKEVDPAAMFAPQPAAWPARVEPSLFHFAAGEAYRDVTLIVDAPDAPGPAANFNVNVWQGGVPSGGVTVTVTRGGG